MPFFVEIAVDKESEHRSVGPFKSYADARERGMVFAEEGLDVVLTRSDLVCDFCSAPHIHKRLKAVDVTVPEIGWASRGDWGACKRCYTIISSDVPISIKLDWLGEYSAESAKLLHGDEIVNVVFFTGVRMIQSAFFEAWTGEVVEL
jgi:hypothetical protein